MIPRAVYCTKCGWQGATRKPEDVIQNAKCPGCAAQAVLPRRAD